MLNSTPSKRMSSDADEARPYESEYVTYNDVWLFIRRYASTIAICFGLALLFAAYQVYTSPARFSAYAQILIDPNTVQFARETSPVQGQSLDTAQVEGQIAVLRSESLAFSVIAQLKLTDDPEFQPGQPSRLRQLLGLMTRGFTAPTLDYGGDAGDVARRVALDVMLGNLDVRRVGPSYAITIGYTSSDPAKAAKIANAVAETYIQDQLKVFRDAARRNTEQLEQHLEQLRGQLNEAARKLEAFRAGRDYRAPQRPDGAAGMPLGLPGQRIGVGGQAAGSGQPETPPVQVTPGGASEVTLAELQSTVESYRKSYEVQQQILAETVQRQALQVSNARIITAATRPLNKSEPRSSLIMAFGGMSGLLAGLAIAFLRHSLDNTVRSAKQIRVHTGLPCLALIPELEKEPAVAPAFPPKPYKFGPPPPPVPDPLASTDDFRVVVDAPFSPFTGSLKTLKTAITNADDRRPIRCVGITSSMPEEGKSTIAANLGALFSLSTGRTLIIDADIHHATISQRFAPNARIGLLEVVTGAAGYDRAIVMGAGLMPDILPVAATEAPVSYDLLASENMRVLLRSLRDHYDMVIVDLPPVNPIVDSVAIAAILDGVVIISAWGHTPVDVVSDVAGVLYTAQANVLGVAITKVDKSMATVRWRKHWGYGYYRSHTRQKLVDGPRREEDRT